MTPREEAITAANAARKDAYYDAKDAADAVNAAYNDELEAAKAAYNDALDARNAAYYDVYYDADYAYEVELARINKEYPQ